MVVRGRNGAEPAAGSRASPAWSGATAEEAGPAAAGPLSREDILAAYTRTGYSLEHHPAHIIRRAHQRATAAFQEVLAGDDLTPTQFAALAVLLHHGVLSQNHLGRLTAMDPSTISLVVRTLSKRGLITRRPSEKDQRLSLVALTELGAGYALERLDRSMDVARRLLAPLSAAEQATLLTLLRRIAGLEEEAS